MTKTLKSLPDGSMKVRTIKGNGWFADIFKHAKNGAEYLYDKGTKLYHKLSKKKYAKKINDFAKETGIKEIVESIPLIGQPISKGFDLLEDYGLGHSGGTEKKDEKIQRMAQQIVQKQKEDLTKKAKSKYGGNGKKKVKKGKGHAGGVETHDEKIQRMAQQIVKKQIEDLQNKAKKKGGI